MTSEPQWYLERPEPETVWAGVLRRRPSMVGPSGRTRLLFELEDRDGRTLPIYGPPAEEALDGLADRHVGISGKLVDLSAEGLGRELWIWGGEAVRVKDGD